MIRDTPTLLLENKELIKRLEPDLQEIDFSIANWLRHFPDDDEIAGLCRQFQLDRDEGKTGCLTRGDVATLARTAASKTADWPSRKRLLIATFMWGYGERGGRSYTNAKRALRDEPRTDANLSSCAEAVRRRDLLSAYSGFNIPGYRQGYFTKYLYFIGTSTHSDRSSAANPPPLIYDSVLVDKLAYLRVVLKEPSLQQSFSKPAQRYVDYCTKSATWAEDLNATVDQLELFLYDLELKDPLEPLLRIAAVAQASLEATHGDKIEESLRQLPEYVTRALPRHLD